MRTIKIDSFVLKNNLKFLTGKESWKRFYPPHREQLASITPKIYDAAVMVLIYEEANNPCVMLIRRTKNTKDKHSGQISFPGGKYDDDDSSFVQTALRETQEEIGINAKNIEIIGALSSLFVPVSGFEIHPILGILKNKDGINLNRSEVESLIEMPLAMFLDRSRFSISTIKFGQNAILTDIPQVNIDEKVPLWGATAMILEELMDVMFKS